MSMGIQPSEIINSRFDRACAGSFIENFFFLILDQSKVPRINHILSCKVSDIILLQSLPCFYCAFLLLLILLSLILIDLPMVLMHYWNAEEVKYNYHRFQEFNSFNCGHLCLKFLTRSI